MTSRRVLWLLVFFGFAVNYMIRININIAIVGMVRHPKSRGGRASDECLHTTAVPAGNGSGWGVASMRGAGHAEVNGSLAAFDGTGNGSRIALAFLGDPNDTAPVAVLDGFEEVGDVAGILAAEPRWRGAS